MSEEFRNRFNYEFDQSKAKDFSTHELENFPRSPYSIVPHSPSDQSSRALAGAMRALQEKIKILESELSASKDQISVLESKSANDREKWQSRLVEEIQMSKEKENYLQSRQSELEEEIKKLHCKWNSAEEQIKIKDIQCKFAENESKRSADQFSVEIENLALQLEFATKSLNAKAALEKKNQKIVDQALRDKELAEEELKQQKRINSGLQAEVNYLRENSDYKRNSLQKSYETVEQELTSQNFELQQKVKEYEIKNKSLKELTHNQQQQILHLKKEIFDINRSTEASSTLKLDLIKSKSIIKKPPITRSRKSVSPVQKIREKSSRKVFENDEDFKRQISLCEKELDKLSNSYRDLICLSSSGSGDLSNLRKEMAKLAFEIEKKNEQLFEYKKKQQNCLKEKLMN